MAATVIFRNDTIREMATWAAKRYRLGRIEIIYCRSIEKSKCGRTRIGLTTPLGNKGPFRIELLEDRTLSFVVQVLAHELAHCITFKRHRYPGHGSKFHGVANELLDAWNSHAKILQEGGDKWEQRLQLQWSRKNRIGEGGAADSAEKS